MKPENASEPFESARSGTALSRVAQEVRARGLTYLGPRKLMSMEQILHEIDRMQVPGDIVEFGIALGGSSIVLAKEMAAGRTYTGYDVFAMIPPPSEHDTPAEHDRYKVIAAGQSQGLNGNLYYGYEKDLYRKVRDNFAAFGVPVDEKRIRLIKGLFQDTVAFEPERKIALAHIDCDWYDPVLFCLTKIYPVLSQGGMIVLDDYNDWEGCRKATDEFLARHRDLRLRTSDPHAVIVREKSFTPDREMS